MNGFTDKPVSTLNEDVFGVTQYITGLNEFIMECDTPMTIAIQGDWGSGKTSMMNMIREQLGDRVVTSWFNTWQYSQFNMDDALAVSFLSRLITDLETDQDHRNARMKKALKTISKFVKNTGVIMIDTLVGGKVAETVESSLQAAEQNEIDMPQAINELKTQFQSVVDAKIAQSGKDRLVIFIDDLDRLYPGRAVELLEVLKLFLDCDNCVFVLAIDYTVVSQGVKQKYGELLGEEKGRSFFDKIIQVPFKMPVAQYDVRNYVTTSLKSLGIELSNEEINTYVRLIQTSVSCNPRAMKRLFNAFLLLNKVASHGSISQPSQRKTLFAILCLQLSFENIYNYIVRNPEECYDGVLLQTLTSPDTFSEGEEADKLPLELQLNTEAEIQQAVAFMSVFNSVLDQDNSGSLSEEEISSFVSILRFSTITANSATEAAAENNLENRYRYYNRDIIKDLNNIINEKSACQFKVYQARTNNNPNWKKHYAGSWTHIPCAFGKVGVEFKITTNLQTKESDLSIWVYPVEKTDRHRFKECLDIWVGAHQHGFSFLEDSFGYWLSNKTVHADARQDIIDYFSALIPQIIVEIKAHL